MSFDSDALKKSLKGGLSLNPKKNLKSQLELHGDPANIFRTGRTAATKLQEKQSLLIERQRQVEQIKLAEADDEIARRKTLAQSGKAGRKSLISTSEQGATTLGGA